MKDILSDIIAHKRIELAHLKKEIPVEELRLQAEKHIHRPYTRRSMKQALATSSTGIIAEFKRRSPSKGWINRDADPVAIAREYEAAGASALSVLTDEDFFGGSLSDLRAIRGCVDLPILRKDFIIDEYQLLQACLSGADAVLLIAACLSQEECAALTEQAHILGLEVLLEVHGLDELQYITPAIDMAGINNRNLGSFHTDVNNSFLLAAALQEATCGADNPLPVSESGISHPDIVHKLRKVGFRGFLIGETFMGTISPGDTLADFIRSLEV